MSTHHQAQQPGTALPAGQVRSLGLVGGMSWHSTALYYERLNRALETRLGPYRSFKGQICNLNYAELLAAAREDRWPDVEAAIVEAIRQLARSGCGVIALTAITAHRFHDAAVRACNAFVPHVFEAVARDIEAMQLERVGVIGTSFTCNSAFVEHYLGRNSSVLRLDEVEQASVDVLIQDILAAGGNHAAGAAVLSRAVSTLEARGAQAIVLGCTELPLLLPLVRANIPLIDTVASHVDQLCQLILSGNNAG
jgi:aspartate racemase